ncbi:hypothetical protein BABINDRAFT_175852 [Babjeviella inositovora NRRL Y-12698]|uniref:SCD domain-containing protein n=1 Tax=Babjeviella inositovora NRRL Y-12698 TaxID=984486 RepID=A0A1E3QPR7_9ASCO|nr:uncharacterized protein BABINDRAFT_175852 [Babjeviella inositovora NRRL Y-12698]ODQ79675.1 hypothetical protein BABINDRAFT_175852 [Babjeviella inositovora NRRL Y-12698]
MTVSRTRAREVITYHESSDSEVPSDDEPEFQIKTAPKRKNSAKSVNTKRAKRVEAIEADDFVENHLYQALSSPESSVVELVQDWLDDYAAGADRATRDLLNFLLRCCGCTHQLEEHDVLNLESAQDTVGELQAIFALQAYHEYPFASRRTELRFFRRNCLDFISSVVELANEKGLLEDEGDFMEKLLTWFSALSSSNLRPLRHVATLFLLNMETKLCEVVVKTANLLEKNQRQLENESAKQADIKEKIKTKKQRLKTEKEAKKLATRVETVEKTIALYSAQKVTLEDYLKDISNTTFVHRYRDVDPQIRVECMKHLGLWMDIYPELFFESTYLRYFGWLLNDASHLVRVEVVRALTRLYRKGIIVPGFRQFTERFKGVLVTMLLHDADFQVRSALVHLLTEVAKVGFLEHAETVQIASLIFHREATEGNTAKLHAELGKFIELAEADQTRNYREKFQVEILNMAGEFPIDLDEMIKFRGLVELLSQAQAYETDSKDESNDDSATDIFSVARSLFHLPRYKSWEFMVTYLLLDLSSVKALVPLSEFCKIIELLKPHQVVLFDLIAGATALILSDDPLKKKEADYIDLVVTKTVQYLPLLLTAFQASPALLSCFIRFFGLFDIARFRDLHQECVYFATCKQLLRLFPGNIVEVASSGAKAEMRTFFASILLTDQYVQQELQAEVNQMTSLLASQLRAHIAGLSTAGQDSLVQMEETVEKLVLVGSLREPMEMAELCEAVLTDVMTYLPDLGLAEASNRVSTAVEVLFQLLLAFSASRLERMMRCDSYEVQSALPALPDYFSEVLAIVKAFRVVFCVENAKNFSVQLRASAAAAYIDIMTAFKILYVKFKGSHNFELFDRFFEDDLNELVLAASDQESLLNVFLYREAALADVLGVDLDRGEDEGVNYSTGTEVEKAQAESDLGVYTLKLLSLKHVMMLGESVAQRLGLNKLVLGELFAGILVEKSHALVEAVPDQVVSQADPIEEERDILLDTVLEIQKVEDWEEGFSQVVPVEDEQEVDIHSNEVIDSSDD